MTKFLKNSYVIKKKSSKNIHVNFSRNKCSIGHSLCMTVNCDFPSFPIHLLYDRKFDPTLAITLDIASACFSAALVVASKVAA